MCIKRAGIAKNVQRAPRYALRALQKAENETMDRAILRIIDANINRSREALRVCEDIARFVLENRIFAARLKSIRHALTHTIKKLPVKYRALLRERSSRNDVGRDMVIMAKKTKSVHDVFIRNMKRAQEALRVLEEFTKIMSPARSRDFQRIRFRLYEAEKQILSKWHK